MKINIDKTIIKVLYLILGIKFFFSYLNVELDWWQRHLTPNIEKFNFFNLSIDFTRNLEYLIIPLIIIYLLKNYKYLGWYVVTPIIISSLCFLNIITSFLKDKPIFSSLEYTIKFSVPILFFLCLIIHKKKYQFDFEKVVKYTILYLLGLTVVGLIIFDPSYNHWENWLPVYFTSLHTHNYVLVSIGIGIAYLFYKNGKYIYLISFLFIYFVFLYFGYNIRSALFFFLVFVVGITYVINSFFKVLWVKILVFTPIILALYLTFNNSFDLNRYSSGRVSMYEAKLEMLKDYTVTEYMFGRGKGSDFITTEDWWYAKKNSHNDLLTFLVENGVLYLLLFLFLILSLVIHKNKINIITFSIILGYLSASFLSNGLPLRPLAGYVLFLILAYIHSDIYLKTDKIKYN